MIRRELSPRHILSLNTEEAILNLEGPRGIINQTRLSRIGAEYMEAFLKTRNMMCPYRTLLSIQRNDPESKCQELLDQYASEGSTTPLLQPVRDVVKDINKALQPFNIRLHAFLRRGYGLVVEGVLPDVAA